MDTLQTSFGMLRPWNDGDVAALAKYANNRNIWLNLRDGFPHPYTLENAQAFIRMAGKQAPVTFGALATSAEAIGGIGITINADVHRLTAELGYWLAEPYWGRGIMTEAVTRFTDYVFERFGLLRVYAEPYATNANSCHVLEKAGFALEGRLKSSVIKDGQILDQFMYARVKEIKALPVE
jgi:[ribosomal protein S5]-alanine N-acetyltransferase